MRLTNGGVDWKQGKMEWGLGMSKNKKNIDDDDDGNDNGKKNNRR